MPDYQRKYLEAAFDEFYSGGKTESD